MPANKSRVVWLKPPSGMVEALDKYGVKVFDAILATAEFFATKIQNEARRGAKWQDRSGAARSGIFAVATKAAKETVEIYLSHGMTVEYGKWLELAHSGRFAILWPTIEKNLPELKRLLDGIFK